MGKKAAVAHVREGSCGDRNKQLPVREANGTLPKEQNSLFQWEGAVLAEVCLLPPLLGRNGPHHSPFGPAWERRRTPPLLSSSQTLCFPLLCPQVQRPPLSLAPAPGLISTFHEDTGPPWQGLDLCMSLSLMAWPYSLCGLWSNAWSRGEALPPWLPPAQSTQA